MAKEDFYTNRDFGDETDYLDFEPDLDDLDDDEEDFEDWASGVPNKPILPTLDLFAAAIPLKEKNLLAVSA